MGAEGVEGRGPPSLRDSGSDRQTVAEMKGRGEEGGGRRRRRWEWRRAKDSLRRPQLKRSLDRESSVANR